MKLPCSIRKPASLDSLASLKSVVCIKSHGQWLFTTSIFGDGDLIEVTFDLLAKLLQDFLVGFHYILVNKHVVPIL